MVIRNGSDPKYVNSGYVLFSRDGYLMAQRFDAEIENYEWGTIFGIPQSVGLLRSIWVGGF